MRGMSKPRMHWREPEREKEAAREAQRRIWDAAVWPDEPTGESRQ